MMREFPVPAQILPRAQAWLDRQAAGADAMDDDVPPRQAATVMLLREGAAGLEVFMLRRNPGMAFAAGMHVFPGGAVDQRDGDPALAWFGPPAEVLAESLGTDPGHARRLLVAAVRETFEECGVLLAGQDPTHLVDQVTDQGWEQDREALAENRTSLAEVLGRRGLGVRADVLRPWAHWITPRFERRRFEARFFAAALPAGQQARDLGGEADQAHWLAPAEGLRQHEAGEAMLMPPTRVCLEELAQAGAVRRALDSARTLRPVLPRLVRSADAVVMQADLP